MVLLTIDFQEGFQNDTVVVSIDGEQALRKDDMHTQMLLGVAESVEIEVLPGRRTIDIAVPTRGLAHQVDLELMSNAYLGVSIVDGELDVIVADEPFGYM